MMHRYVGSMTFVVFSFPFSSNMCVLIDFRKEAAMDATVSLSCTQCGADNVTRPAPTSASIIHWKPLEVQLWVNHNRFTKVTDIVTLGNVSWRPVYFNLTLPM
jgi:hypothetical protein